MKLKLQDDVDAVEETNEALLFMTTLRFVC